MKKYHVALSCLLLSVVAFILSASSSIAADCPSGIKAVTTSDAQVSIEVLAHRLKPLTKCELEVEARAWMLLLKAKVTEISNAEIAAIYAKEDSVAHKADLNKEIKAASSKAQQTKTDIKTALLQHVTDLTGEKTALIDRLQTVLKELRAKGGNGEEYDNYIKAVSGIKVNVSDASAMWTTISGWLVSAEGGLRWAANIIKFTIIVILFYLLALVSAKAARRMLSKSERFSTLLREFLVQSTRRVVLFLGLFVGLSALEVNLAPVLTVIGAAGFVIAFALQNSLSNFASGILMLIYRPFDIDDVINVAGVLGTVESMNLLSTQLRTPDNQLVIVPNNSVWGDVITNVTGITERRVDMVFGIGYGDDTEKAQHILETILNEHELVLQQPAPVVKLHELADSSVNFICRPWVKPANYWDVYWDVTQEVKRRFDAAAISIPFPQSDVHIYRENTDGETTNPV